ncbi:MAG: type II toxin-antitoxin system RelE/ParE family toxin [Terrimesophilobacter sp.]
MVDRFNVQLSKKAAKELRRLDRPVQDRVVKALALLRDHPRPAAVTALTGHPGYLRVRIGDYRIVYTVNDGLLLVLVLTIGHRRSVYDSLT